MQEKDQDIIQKLVDGNPRFRMLFEEHLLLEKELRKFEDRNYLSPAEEVEKKKVQKLKLAGKDEMERILSNLRQ